MTIVSGNGGDDGAARWSAPWGPVWRLLLAWPVLALMVGISMPEASITQAGITAPLVAGGAAMMLLAGVGEYWALRLPPKRPAPIKDALCVTAATTTAGVGAVAVLGWIGQSSFGS